MAKKSSKKSSVSTVSGVFAQFVPQAAQAAPAAAAPVAEPAAVAGEPAPVGGSVAITVEAIEGLLATTKAYGSAAPAARHEVALGVARVLGVKLRGAPVAADPAKYGNWAEFCSKKLGAATAAQAQTIAQPETLVPLPAGLTALEHKAKSALVACFEKDEKAPQGEIRVRGLYLDKAGKWQLAAGRGFNMSPARLRALVALLPA